MSGCDGCGSNGGGLRRLGFKTTDADYVVALAGNPNTGKSTVFNSLTGLRQHTGNWPGKTVMSAEGGFSYADKRYRLVDLPGTYSLLASSTDEEVARDYLLFGRPDVTVVVTDATRLERNLNLVLQVLEISERTVVCVNLMDEARRKGIDVDDRRLARDLGVPVVATTARRNEGIRDLLRAIHEVATGETVCQPRRIEFTAPEVTSALDALLPRIEALYPGLPNARWVAARLVEGDPSIVQALETGRIGEIRQEYEVAR